MRRFASFITHTYFVVPGDAYEGTCDCGLERMAIPVNPKTTLYVGAYGPPGEWACSRGSAPMLNCNRRCVTGGLDENVNEAVLHAAFLPFGEVKDVNIPLDQATQKNRGFGFVTFVEK